MTDLAGLSVSPHHATECVVSTDNFEFFTELTNILVQVSKPDTNVSPDTQGLAIAAKVFNRHQLLLIKYNMHSCFKHDYE